MRALFFLIPLILFSQESMLIQADSIAKRFALEVAKAAPPSSSPQTLPCLNTASVFFTLDLHQIDAPAFTTLNSEKLWDQLREIGVQAVHLKNLKKGGLNRTGIGLDPEWGDDWDSLAMTLQKRGILLIGDSIGNATGLTSDFFLALKNIGDYPSLYHLIEIEKRDWKMLPNGSGSAVNVPWLTLQELHKKGYVPEQYDPYVKASCWNATPQIKCDDGQVRRWIYLKENEGDPVIDWLNPSFAGCRIASADLLDSMYNLGQKIICLDGSISPNAKQTLSLWARKLGGYSVQECKGGIQELTNSSADLMTDTLTRSALLHALLTQDTEALKLMYRLFLEGGIETRRLVHALQPFEAFPCDWAELAVNPWKKFKYYEEVLTGEALRTRLMKEDVARIAGPKPTSWPSYCAAAMGFKDLDKHRDDIKELHLLLALFYAMQPGAFSFSLSDLLGLVDAEHRIYAKLGGQMGNPKSFAQQLRKILDVRREQEIGLGELVAVPITQQPGLLILVHKVRGQNQITAINFSRAPVQQTLEIPSIRLTTAIDLMTGLAENKPLESSTIRLNVPPLSGKILLFQTKYYD